MYEKHGLYNNYFYRIDFTGSISGTNEWEQARYKQSYMNIAIEIIFNIYGQDVVYTERLRFANQKASKYDLQISPIHE